MPDPMSQKTLDLAAKELYELPWESARVQDRANARVRITSGEYAECGNTSPDGQDHCVLPKGHDYNRHTAADGEGWD